MFLNGRSLKKFDENENDNRSIPLGKELDGNGKGESIAESMGEYDIEIENERKNEFQGKSVNGGFKRTRSEDTYSTAAPVLIPSPGSAFSASPPEVKPSMINKAMGLIKTTLSIGKVIPFF